MMSQIRMTPTTQRKRLELWGFLQAFQKSPHKYLYIHQILDGLEQIQDFSRESLIQKLRQINDQHENWFLKILPLSDIVINEELLSYQDSFQFVFYGEKDFPQFLKNISDPPLALSYQGDLKAITPVTISVVGSREPHEFSTNWMQSELYNFLKNEKPCVISGGARGIDQKAHFISILLGLPTVVILPTGLNEKYPLLWNDKKWLEKPLLFVSEMRLGEKISKKNFSFRNRLIAAWGMVTLVVEARKRSGTVITAHHALAEGRSLWIVPGHPQMPSFAGSLELAQEHGQIVGSVDDLSSLFHDELKNYAWRPLALAHEVAKQL